MARRRFGDAVARPQGLPVDRPRGVVIAGNVFAGLTGVLATIGVLGWIFEVDRMKQILPNVPTVKMNTAVALLLLAVAHFAPRVVALVLAGLTGLLAVLTLLEYAARIDIGIDQLFEHDPSHNTYPGRMSLVTATCIALLSAGVILRLVGRATRAQVAAFVALLLSALTLLGYAYDVPVLYKIKSVSTIAVPTGVGVLLLSLAGLAAVPGGAFDWAVRSGDAGAVLMRRLVPVVLIVLPVIGFVSLLGERAGWFGVSTTAATIVVAGGLLVGVFTWRAARRVTRAERRRERAISELTDLRVDLERQVTERAEQLQSRRNEIAVLEDRQRIAADLHDIVIQRLFAAGMFLQGSTGASTDPDVRDRVDTVVEAMDTAIKDLRASIFELGGRGALRQDLTTALDEVCVESARVLGFAPDLTVDDPERDAEQAREDILAVVREGLANVARHAGASRVGVDVRSGDGVVAVTITDDGTGMTQSGRASGTRNMAERARGSGGGCTWSPVEPHGTRVSWWVPVAVTPA